jgi:penicillin-binding protein 1A
VRQGVLDFERRQFYRGPELFINLPEDAHERDTAIDEALAERPDNGDLLSAVVLQVDPKKVVVVRQDDEPIEITGEGLKPVQTGLSEKAGPNVKLRPGAVVRIVKVGENSWRITQLPEVESAFIALDPRNGRISALTSTRTSSTTRRRRGANPAPASSPSSTPRHWKKASRP